MRESRRSWSWLAVPGIVLAVDGVAYAQVYLTVEQAQQAIFPGETFSEMPLTLTDQQRAEIKKMCGVNVRHATLPVWRTSAGGFFIVDDVLGKHEFITYAIGLHADGTVKQIEIMEYRETYGDQIRNAPWRQQFVGKTSHAPLKLDQDIKNISGATLSCRHVTDGVKRVLTTYELYLQHRP